ncbi:MAG: GNAT family N-acetyltransferase [Thermomicrobiales bacterium]|nr:GNAT family N-acetyltransferase [Thermomicrobiales bacterium]
MTISMTTTTVNDLPNVIHALRAWQLDDTPFQLHPGDIGWFWRAGADQTATALRTWRRDGELVAIGLLDGPEVLRLAIMPGATHDRELALTIAGDVSDPERGVLTQSEANVEAANGTLIRDVLIDAGWTTGESWTPLGCDLSEPVEIPEVRIAVIDAATAEEHVAIVRSAFARSTFSFEKWRTMAASPAFDDARCLAVYNSDDDMVGTVTVWSAGPGRRGLIEPLGVHPDHRGHGYGRAITLAGAIALQQLGASSITVATQSANVPAVATYKSAGMHPLGVRHDLHRPT